MTPTTSYRSKIIGTGHFLPEKIVTNDDLAQIMDTSHDWVVERTGIHGRRYAEEGVATSDLCLKAAQQAIEAANIKATDLDMILVATVTPDLAMPSTACYLQTKLGAGDVMAFDLAAACSGFLYGLTVANQFILTGAAKNILVLGAEILHNYIDFEDRSTAILFGDGAGAAVISRAAKDDISAILATPMHADGDYADLLRFPATGSADFMSVEKIQNKEYSVQMNGREVFKQAVKAMTNACNEALEQAGVDKSEVDWIIPHQANIRIMDSVAKHFDISKDKVINVIEDMGNTSAATIPVAMNTAIRDGRIQRGDKLLLTAFGSGLTSGSVLLTF